MLLEFEIRAVMSPQLRLPRRADNRVIAGKRKWFRGSEKDRLMEVGAIIVLNLKETVVSLFWKGDEYIRKTSNMASHVGYLSGAQFVHMHRMT